MLLHHTLCVHYPRYRIHHDDTFSSNIIHVPQAVLPLPKDPGLIQGDVIKKRNFFILNLINLILSLKSSTMYMLIFFYCFEANLFFLGYILPV